MRNFEAYLNFQYAYEIDVVGERKFVEPALFELIRPFSQMLHVILTRKHTRFFFIRKAVFRNLAILGSLWNYGAM